MLPLGSLFLLMGLNSSLSSPTSEQVCKKKGEGSVGLSLNNWVLITNHDLIGCYGLKVNSGLENFVSFAYEFNLSPW